MADAAVVSADLHRRGLELFREGKYQEASQILAEALKSGEDSELWNDWATAQLMCNQAAESERGYRRALELNPRSGRAAGNLGIFLASKERVPEALPLLERAASQTSGAERERLLRLLETYCRRGANAATPGHISANDSLTQIASVIYRQSQVIADLSRRLSALESRLVLPNILPTHFAHTASQEPARGLRQKEKSGGQKSKNVKTKKPLGNRHLEAAGSPNPSADSQRTAIPPAGIRGAPAAPAQCSSKRGTPKPGIYFNGIVYGGSGYAEEGWMAALGMAERQMPVQLVPVGEPVDTQKLIPEASRKKLELLEHELVDLPKSVIFQSSPAPGWNLDREGRLRVGRTMFETDRLPDTYREACNTMDEVWVPSRFNMETFARAGVDRRKLRLVPGGVDTHVFRPNAAPLEIPKKRRFNFLSVFDWHWRKGYDILLHAYLREFTSDDDVALILKVYQLVEEFADLEARISHFIERSAGLSMQKAPTVILINGFIPQEEMARLYASAHALVLPSRGEAYGRPYMEAMACQLPVIATKWSGQMDFLNNENSYLIESKLTSVPPDVEIEVYKGHLWAEPSLDHLRQLMRDVYAHPEEARRKAERGRKDILRKYDWAVVLPRWVNEFERLLN